MLALPDFPHLPLHILQSAVHLKVYDHSILTPNELPVSGAGTDYLFAIILTQPLQASQERMHLHSG